MTLCPHCNEVECENSWGCLGCALPFCQHDPDAHVGGVCMRCNTVQCMTSMTAEGICVDQDACDSRCPEFVITKLTEEEFSSLAEDLVGNRAWMAQNEEEFEIAFRLIVSGLLMSYRTDSLKKICTGIAPMSDAFPRAINGIPMFASARFLDMDDTNELLKRCSRIYEAIQKASAGTG